MPTDKGTIKYRAKRSEALAKHRAGLPLTEDEQRKVESWQRHIDRNVSRAKKQAQERQNRKEQGISMACDAEAQARATHATVKWRLKTKFGLTMTALYSAFALQDGRCAICKRDMIWSKKADARRVCVDHCHETGKFRALLCGRCNKGIGLFKDRADWCREAAAYLDTHKG